MSYGITGNVRVIKEKNKYIWKFFNIWLKQEIKTIDMTLKLARLVTLCIISKERTR